MLQNFQMSDGLLSRYSRLLCKTVIPIQEAVPNDRVEGVASSHAIDNFRNAAYLQTGEKAGDFYGMVFQDSDVAKWLEGSRLVPTDPDELYFTDNFRREATQVKLIPYFMWGNRGLDEMRVWLPVQGA